MADRPIKFEQILDTARLGVKQGSVNPNTTTMQSDKFLCVREVVEGQPPQVVVLDLTSASMFMRRAIQADSTIMHPISKVLALRAGQQLQIFNLEMKTKMKSHQMNEDVTFWKWIDTKTIAIVTASSVYHWSMDGAEAPKKIFDKLPDMMNATIVNYKTDNSGKWLVLVGVTQGPRGIMQLHSVEKQANQQVPGFTADFIKFGEATALCFADMDANGGKLTIIPVAGSGLQKQVVPIPFPADAQRDIPYCMECSDKYGIVQIVSRSGYIFLFDVETGTPIFTNRISGDPVFLSTRHQSSSGLLALNTKGQLLMVCVDPAKLVPYCTNTLQNAALGIRFASRCGLPGAEGVFEQQFSQLMAQGQYQQAARLAAESPQGVLRNHDTLQRFKQLPHQPPNPPPLLQYFHAVMEKTKLNKLESVELARIVVNQGKHQLLEKWIKEDKVECSEDLGDVVANVDANLALSVYLRAEASDKVIQAFVSMQQYEKIVKYAQHVGHTPDYFFLLQNIVARDPAGAVTFAQLLANNEGGTLLEWGRVADVFISRNMIKEATSFLLDVLKGDREEDADLQTRLLEINLHTNPQVANYILGQNMFSQYNAPKIAQLCERAGLHQRALEHYTDLVDIKRCIVNTQSFQPEFLVEYFAGLGPEDGMDCLKELLRANQQQNMQVAVQIATKYTDKFPAEPVMKMFEKFNCWKGLFYYLGAICVMSQDPEVHFKYIEAAVKCGQLKEVERHTRESDFYDARRAADFLMEMKLPDQRPLIHVCDRFDMVDELTAYLFTINQVRVLEVYCKQVNPLKTPVVIGTLLDKGGDEQWIMETLMAVGNMCPAKELVAEVEERGRLKLISPWLEARKNEGSTEVPVFNALAKIYIDNNQSPERFLEENEYYDSLEVGKYCEKRDPILAFIAYKKNSCDEPLIEVTNKNGLFRQQAAYLVDRSDEELWQKVLTKENPHMRHVIDQVVGVALPACKDANKVGSTVKAFMSAELPQELIELLEKIVLHGTDFAQNENLQNLLILTAIKADPSRVMDYINRLDNFQGMEIANIAISSELFEEAFAIYKKFNFHEEAVGVLIDHIHSLERAEKYAEKVNVPPVWSLLARAQLQQTPPLTKEAIASYIKANDARDFVTVVRVAEREECFADAILFLKMARKSGVKEPFVDNSLLYAYARVDKLGDMEDMVSGQPHVAKLEHVGNRCFDEELFKAAKLLFNAIPKYGRLATALVKLGEFSAAVDAARKAKANKCWKEVMVACVDKEEFRLAQMCAINLVVSPDDLEMVVATYEARGHFKQLSQVLENATNLDRAHMGIFTELGIQYAKHRPAKLMEHLQMHKQRLNIRKLQRVCEMCRLWGEVAFLYGVAEEFDSAVSTMMEHPTAWDHSKFKDTIARASNTELIYRAVGYYLNAHPLLLVDLLSVVKQRVDNARVVADIGAKKSLPLIKAYLEDVQPENNKKVNDALNALYVEEEAVEALRHSIESYDEFDHIALAQQLEKHALLEFRRVAALIYKTSGRFEQSVALSKQDKLYKDAMETARDSNDQALAEELLRFFVEIDSKECFAACLYHCFDLIRADVVLELAWRFDLMNLAMPFMVQTMRSLTERVDELENANKALKEKVGDNPAPAAVAGGGGAVMDDSMNDGSAYYDQGLAMQYQTMIASQAMPAQMAYNQQSYYGQ